MLRQSRMPVLVKPHFGLPPEQNGGYGSQVALAVKNPQTELFEVTIFVCLRLVLCALHSEPMGVVIRHEVARNLGLVGAAN